MEDEKNTDNSQCNNKKSSKDSETSIECYGCNNLDIAFEDVIDHSLYGIY